MYKVKKYFLSSRWHVSRLALNVIVIISFALGASVGSYLITSEIIIPRVFAAVSPFLQTDWSGGVSPGVVTTSPTTYDSEANIRTSVSGEITLRPTAGWSSDYLAWAYRRSITFDNTDATLGMAAEALTNFVVLIKLDAGQDIDYDKTKDAGEDVRFTDSDGTPIPYEIEKWDESGSSWVWVNVPQIDQNSNTDKIYIYYGNSSAADAQAPSSVWGANDYSMIYHFKEPSGTVADSTTNTTATVRPGTSLGQQGQIGNAVDFSSSNGGITLGTLGPPLLTANTTISFWIYLNNLSSPARQNPFGQAYGGWGTMTLEQTGAISWFFGSHGGNSSPYSSNQSSSGTISNGQWINITAVRDNTAKTYSWYKNGQYLTGSTYSANYPTIQNQPFNIGDDYVYPINGKMDEFRVHKSTKSAAFIKASYLSETDAFVSYGIEEVSVAPTGSLISNVFDAEYAADWEELSFRVSGAGAVSIEARSDSSPDMSGTPWNSCGININDCTLLSGQYTCGSLSAIASCVSDADRYIQYRATLTASGASSPKLEELSIVFSASDQVAPSSNATSIKMYTEASKSREISGTGQPNWNNAVEPYFEWAEGSDADSGVKGYCLYLGTSAVGDPGNASTQSGSAGILDSSASPVATSGSYCQFIVPENTEASTESFDLSDYTTSDYFGSPLISGTTYYLNIKAIDKSNNIYSGQASSFSFKQDSSVPANVGYISAPSTSLNNVVDMFFNWPISGGGQANDANSGILGYQYQINSNDSAGWKGTETDSTCQVQYIPAATATYQLTEIQDEASISEGNNIVYLRTIDNACNPSPSNTYRTANLAFGGDAPAFLTSCQAVDGVKVSPVTNTQNSFALSWEAALVQDGDEIDSYYYFLGIPPSSYSTITSNASTYKRIGDTTSVSAGPLVGAIKGNNTVYVVAVDSSGNYSPSNCIKGEFTLNSTLPDPPRNLSVSDASIKANTLWRASIGWDIPAYAGTGSLTYKIQRSVDGSSWVDVTTTTGNSYIDTVPESKVYYWRVGVYDTSSESQAAPTFTPSVTLYPKGTFTSPPDLSSGPDASNITTKKASVSWGTTRTSDSKVQYGTAPGSYFDEEPSQSAQVTDHTIQLSGLNPGTTYYYRARYTDEDGNTGESEEGSFTTDPAPTVTDPKMGNIGLDSAVISFTTKGAVRAKIYFGPTSNFGGLKEISTSTVESDYTALLEGLEDGTKYFYKINTFDSEDEEYEGSTLTFETLPRPKITEVRVQQVKGTAQPTILLTWRTNTEVSSVATYFPQGNAAAARDEVNVALVAGEHQMVVRGLLANTNYTLIVKGRDKAGNEAQSEPLTVTTASDTRPAKISNLKIESAIVPTTEGTAPTAQLIVSWDTDEPATSQIEYAEGTGSTYSQKTQEDSSLTFNHLVIVSGLTPSKVYHLRALSADSSGNKAESIDTVTITPKSSRSALDLVITSLTEAFGFIRRR